MVGALRAIGADVQEDRLPPRVSAVVGDSVVVRATDESRDRFGRFAVIVHPSAREAEDELGETLDGDGISWKRGIPEVGPQLEQISAVKVYGNVALRWFPDEPRVDERWIALDGALSSLT